MNRRSFIAASLATALPLPALAQEGQVQASDWPAELRIGTASPGGTYYSYGEGLAKLLTRELRRPVTIQATDGPEENIRLLTAGSIQIAFVTIGAATAAWNTADVTGAYPARQMRVLFPMYDTAFQFAVPEASDIRSVADLAGKRIGVGPSGGTGGTYLPRVFRTLGVSPTLVNGQWPDLAARLGRKELDGLAVTAGVPFPTFGDIEKTSRLRFLPLDSRQTRALHLAMPELAVSVVPAGTYPTLASSLTTVGLYNFAVVREDLPDDLVFAITRAVFENRNELVRNHPAAAETLPRNYSRNTFIPFHDGVARWYGSVPDAVAGD